MELPEHLPDSRFERHPELACRACQMGYHDPECDHADSLVVMPFTKTPRSAELPEDVFVGRCRACSRLLDEHYFFVLTDGKPSCSLVG